MAKHMKTCFFKRSYSCSEEEILILCLQSISCKAGEIIQQARKDVHENIQEFVSKQIGSLFQIVELYRNAFESTNVKTKKEFEGKVSHFFRKSAVREAFDDMLQKEANVTLKPAQLHGVLEHGLQLLESVLDKKRREFVELEVLLALCYRGKEWDELLQDVDGRIASTGGPVAREGDLGPVSSVVVNAHSGHSSKNEIAQAGGKILVVSFGERIPALKWSTEVCCPFDLVLDQERKVYHAFGLERSVAKVWNIECMLYYAEQLADGRHLPKPYENVQDDPQQMGGDFILDKQGMVKLSYCSKTSSDRPSVDYLLSFMKTTDGTDLPQSSPFDSARDAPVQTDDIRLS